MKNTLSELYRYTVIRLADDKERFTDRKPRIKSSGYLVWDNRENEEIWTTINLVIENMKSTTNIHQKTGQSRMHARGRLTLKLRATVDGKEIAFCENHNGEQVNITWRTWESLPVARKAKRKDSWIEPTPR